MKVAGTFSCFLRGFNYLSFQLLYYYLKRYGFFLPKSSGFKNLPKKSRCSEDIEETNPALKFNTANFDSSLEKRDLVEKLIARLPPVYKSIIVLHYLQDLNCQEIAAILGHPVGTVKAYLHRARGQLRDQAEILLRTRDKQS